ncbi:Oxygen-independent coproporphyrinogen-III oxidase 2 [Bacillus sp. THAF10]|uniref:coproporphyrinogen III oxidase n=1 Tax=Bacillus sp. THAF10 TaxID=2587848 RepID=UPI0012688EAC|nr:coproporphyrinogen III oxidase [Bacillus sp. THAF10]QFT88247.1 Oxygen-independent coproporphyrinogen-III oxidase 2 [Bacillus sp. THAF10]
MKIAILGLDDDRFQRPLALIGDLFFEETEITLGQNTHADLEITFTHQMQVTNDNTLFHVTGQLEGHTSSHTKELTNEDNIKENFRRQKQAISYVYLTLLQQHTGIIQKWGILTGIRPTKLLHSKLQQGTTMAQAHQELRDNYLISEEKINLMQQIVDRQLEVVPDLYHLQNEVSIYIGIPFCPTKCAYCTFPAYAINGKQGKVDSFLGGLHYEIEAIGKWLQENNVKITTVYYGGGTPTSITAEEMDMLYERMYDAFPDMKTVREVTVEAGRPDTITTKKLEVLKKWNIDRISINPQSYTQETLKAIGRHHTVEETIDKFHMARDMGMNNINMDLIIGLPNEGTTEFQHTLEETEKLMPESLTVHTLSFKRASEMTQNKQRYKVADRYEIGEMMDMANEWTASHNYTPYYLYRQKNILGNLENVGYALPGQDSIYNIMIMEEKQTIIGLGCGAASKFIHPQTGKIMHFANPKDPKSYNDGFEHYTKEKIRILDDLFFGAEQQAVKS